MLILRLTAVGLGIGGLSWLAGLAMTSAPGHSPAAPAALTPDEQEMTERLRQHVEILTKDIGERRSRNMPNLNRASQYLWDVLRRTGFRVKEHRVEVDGAMLTAIEGELEGRGRPGEVVVVAAHYDSQAQSPGADDDASGCAVLVELAREVAQLPPLPRTVRMVLFPNGSDPWAGSRRAGSAKWAAERGEGVVAMLALDGLGCYSSEPGSQHRPPPISWFHPDRANYLGFQGDFGSRHLLAQAVESFRGAGRMPAESLLIPGWMPGAPDSDHQGFRKAGIPAVLVTDTQGWRSEEIGTGFDTCDRLDYDSMARATTGLAAVVRDLAR